MAHRYHEVYTGAGLCAQLSRLFVECGGRVVSMTLKFQTPPDLSGLLPTYSTLKISVPAHISALYRLSLQLDADQLATEFDIFPEVGAPLPQFRYLFSVQAISGVMPW